MDDRQAGRATLPLGDADVCEVELEAFDQVEVAMSLYRKGIVREDIGKSRHARVEGPGSGRGGKPGQGTMGGRCGGESA